MRSARRFMIIDNALQTMVGHFYEYDVSVLANLPAGFEGRVFSNVDAPRELDGVTTPFFRCGFWAPSAKAGARRSAAKAQASPATTYVRPAVDAAAAPAPASMTQRAKAWGLQFKHDHGDSWWGRAALRVGMPAYYRWRAREWRREALPETAAPVAASGVTLNAGDAVLRDLFLEDVEDLFAEFDVQPEDVLFFPNMNQWAFAAILKLLEAAPAPTLLPKMLLLFRRNLFWGRPTAEQYLSDDYYIKAFRDLFAQLDHLPADCLTFFTDTERLRDEYEVFCPKRFHVLPIPFRHDYIRQKSAPGHPLRITYLGNARSEKGFQHIPAIVEHLRPRVERGEVQFVLQSVPDPEPVILDAVERLRRSGLVTLLETPLSDEGYYQLVSEADVLLLLYDPVQYYSRSSCIFIESVVSATPFVTRTGSWMSDTMVPGTGEAVASPEDLPQALDLLIDDYPRYFDACRHAGAQWREYHNPKHLVDVMLEACGVTVTPSTSAHPNSETSVHA